MPPPLFGRHDADHPAVATAPKSVRRSFACGTEPTNEYGSVAPAAREGELSAAPSWARGSSSRDELMFGGVQLVLGRVEKGIVNLLTLFGGCQDWSLWRLRRGTRATGIRSRSSGTRCGCITVSR